jgi:hypothetical protein
VKVPHSEGVANHTDPLSASGRLTPHDVGAEGNMDRRDIARSGPIPRGKRPWHMQKLFVRESGPYSLFRRVICFSSVTYLIWYVLLGLAAGGDPILSVEYQGI